MVALTSIGISCWSFAHQQLALSTITWYVCCCPIPCTLSSSLTLNLALPPFFLTIRPPYIQTIPLTWLPVDCSPLPPLWSSLWTDSPTHRRGHSFALVFTKNGSVPAELTALEFPLSVRPLISLRMIGTPVSGPEIGLHPPPETDHIWLDYWLMIPAWLMVINFFQINCVAGVQSDCPVPVLFVLCVANWLNDFMACLEYCWEMAYKMIMGC